MTNFERAQQDVARAARNSVYLTEVALRPLPPLSDEECRKLAVDSIYPFEFLRFFYPRFHS